MADGRLDDIEMGLPKGRAIPRQDLVRMHSRTKLRSIRSTNVLSGIAIKRQVPMVEIHRPDEVVRTLDERRHVRFNLSQVAFCLLARSNVADHH